MSIKNLASFLFCCFSTHFASATDPVVIPSELKTVTVYRTGAELTHQTAVQLLQGSSELIIEGISNAVDMNSIQINCAAAVTVLGIEFGTNFLVLPEVS